MTRTAGEVAADTLAAARRKVDRLSVAVDKHESHGEALRVALIAARARVMWLESSPDLGPGTDAL